jgi:glycosyltransferase involved in cell wall biosynthesis
MKRVREHFAESKNIKYAVVPNGVDLDIFDANRPILSNPLLEKYQGCVLSVARIERLKNQLNLVRAMKDLPWDLLIIGNHAPNHKSYFDQIRKEAGPNVHFIEQIDHALLPQYYKLAKVHALVSWIETTGLSSLEAGAMGCRLVITRKGDTYDYFGDHAFYCEPDDVRSIKNAIIRAYESTADPGSRSHITNNYTWDKAADATLKGYAMVLSR